jgi:signal transduction histidine kinase
MFHVMRDVRDFFKCSLFTKKRANSIGSRLLISVLLVSSLFVVFQTLVQLNNDYRMGLSEIDRRLDQLKLSYGGGLSRSIWEVNATQIQSTIDGMIELPSVSMVQVKELSGEDGEDEVILATSGRLPEADYRQKTLPITIESRGKEIHIGTVSIVISLEKLYQDLYGTVIFIVLFQMVKTFLMSAFILAIFHYLVTKHLVIMAGFAKNINKDNLDELLSLDRKQIGENDEISSMLTALNDTKLTLKKLVETSEATMQMKLDIAQRSEREKSQKLFAEQIEAKNLKLAESNDELESTIDELKNTQDKLVNSEKMAALGGMVQGVAHELNTPIGLSITGASHIQTDTLELTQLLADNKMKKSNLDEYLDNTANLSKSICIGLEKAASLIRSFKLVSVEQHEEIQQNFNVQSNLADILHSINSSVKERNIDIINEIPADILIASFPGVFYQIYTNLINNALLHGFENKPSGVITISAGFSDQMLNIAFKDNGIGMNEAVTKKVFDPFFTTKRARGGTGLGMNIIYNLVNDKLLGSISVESEEGKGTTFNIKVPSLDNEVINNKLQS